MTHRNARSGLTLLETLLSLTVMALLAGMLSSALGLGLRSLGRSDTLADEVNLALSRRQLRDWVEHALPAQPAGLSESLFAGTADQITFLADISQMEPQLPTGSIVLVSFDPNTGRFTAAGNALDEASALITLSPAPDGTRLVFSFWGRGAPDGLQRWHESWPTNAGLPGLLRIEFPGSGLPPMVIRPAKAYLQSEMSLSSLVPPDLPSRP